MSPAWETQSMWEIRLTGMPKSSLKIHLQFVYLYEKVFTSRDFSLGDLYILTVKPLSIEKLSRIPKSVEKKAQ